MSNKQTQQLLKQLVELTGEYEELLRQNLRITGQVNDCKQRRQAIIEKLQVELPLGKFPVQTLHYKADVAVTTSETTEVVSTDMNLVPPQFKRESLNLSMIRAKFKLEGTDSVPGVLLLEKSEKVVKIILI